MIETKAEAEREDCPSCGEPVKTGILTCPHCRYRFRRRSGKAVIGAGLVATALMLAVSAAGISAETGEPVTGNAIINAAPLLLIVGIVLAHMARGDLKIHRTWRGGRVATISLIVGYGIFALAAAGSAYSYGDAYFADRVPGSSRGDSSRDDGASVGEIRLSSGQRTNCPSLDGDAMRVRGGAEVVYFGVQVEGITCGEAGRLIRAWYDTPDSESADGYKCYVASASEQHARYVCESGIHAVRFSFVPG